MTTALPTIARDANPLLTVMRAAGRAGVATLLWGPPGVGKSSLIEGLSDAEGMPSEVVYPALSDPSDFNGLPVIRDHGVDLCAPAWANRLAEAGRGILLLEELTTASPSLQAAALGVALGGVVGSLTLPRDVWRIAAANPPEYAADGWTLAPPLANRFLHLEFMPTADDWIDGMTTGFQAPASGRVFDPTPTGRAVSRAEVASFIRTRPDLLHAMPEDSTAAGRAWPSHRTWTMTADVLALLDPADTAANLLAASGLVGDGAAAEFLTWRSLNDLPDPADVLADPHGVDWAGLDPSRAWAVLRGATAHATAEGTKTGWTNAWAPLAVAADAGLTDVAAANARALIKSRPSGMTPPPSARAFLTVLADAGLIPEAA